jgi:hypothetical protein
MNKYKIRFHNGDVQNVQADKMNWNIDDWVVFADETPNTLVALAAKSDVAFISIQKADDPPPPEEVPPPEPETDPIVPLRMRGPAEYFEEIGSIQYTTNPLTYPVGTPVTWASSSGGHLHIGADFGVVSSEEPKADEVAEGLTDKQLFRELKRRMKDRRKAGPEDSE